MYYSATFVLVSAKNTTATLDELAWVAGASTEYCQFTSWNINTFVKTLH